MNRFKKSIFFMLVVAMAFSYVSAQQATGRLTGKVTDEQGAPLPGVSVEATSPRMPGKAASVTDEMGIYRLFSLPGGLYTVVFKLPGFKDKIRKEIVVQAQETVNLNETLTQSAIAEEVTVIGQSPLIDVKSTVKGGTMTKDIFMQLPRSRNFDGLLSTVPGVQYDGNTGGLSVDGSTGIENMWYMDGADITDPHRGGRAQGAVMELVEEVKVTASGYTAEFAGGMGGVINVITRSGGNEFHGDVYGYYNNNKTYMSGKTNEFLRMNPYIGNAQLYTYEDNDDLYFNGGSNRDAVNRMEGVFNLGGFIFKDKVWFFGSFNPIYQSQDAQRWFLSDPAGNAADDWTKDKIRQGRPLTTFNVKNYNFNAQIKLTAAPIAGMRISASFVDNFSKYRGAVPAVTGSGNILYNYAKEGLDYPDMSAAVNVDYSVSNNLLVSLRGGWAMSNTNNQQLTNPTSIYTFARANTSYADIPDAYKHIINYTNWPGTWATFNKAIYGKMSANLDITYYMNLAGEHAFKFGAQLTRPFENLDEVAAHPRITLNWTQSYAGLATGELVKGTYGYYQVRGSFTSPYGYYWDIHANDWAIYLQDSWTIGQRLTLNLGLRDEYEYIPSFSNDPQYSSVIPLKFNFSQKIAPRLGVVYDVFGDSSLKVFGSFGIYYDVMKLYIAEGAYGGFKWKTDYYELNNYDWTLIAASGKIDDAYSQSANGTNRYVGTMDWRIPSWDSTDPALKPVAQREISFGAEKKLMEDLSLSVRLIQKHLIRTIEDVGVETPAGESYYTCNPGFGYSLPVSQGGQFSDFYWPTPHAKREYYGLNVSLEKRFSNNWQGGFNYTLSRTAGNYGGLASTDEGGRLGPNTERYFDLWFMSYQMNGTPLDGPLPQDRTHYFKAYGSYAFPFGLTVGVVGYGRSGQPISTWLNINNTYQYPNGYGDLGRMPFAVWADLYLEYTLRVAKKYNIGINLTITNVTNTKTWQTVNEQVNRVTMAVSDAEIKSTTFDYTTRLASVDPDPSFKMYTAQMGTWTARLGLRFSF
jgi:hypothetical protein